MTVSQVFEVALGLIVVYYILGAIVSLITQWINEAFETRGRALEKYLIKLVGNKQLGEFISLPQLQSLRPIRYRNMLGVFGAVTTPQRVEKIPVAVLVDAFFDFSGLTANSEMTLLQLADLIDKLPESDGKQAFISWINQGVTNLDDLRKRTTAYFTGILDQAAATFRANARSVVILLSVVITILFGTDSIQLAKTLWTSSELRAIAVAKAELVVAREGARASIDDLVKDLGDLTIKIGWWQMEFPAPDSTAGEWMTFLVLKVAGLGLTVAAVSQGSSFWYDVLRKVASPSTSASKPVDPGTGMG